MKSPELPDQTHVSSLKLLGDYHILRIISALSEGPMRFCTVQRTVDNLNPVTLTDRLKKLEQAGIVMRDETYESERACVYYSLTKLGQSTLPILDAINVFSSKARQPI